VLAGPAGCGKSTILRLIAGLEEISQGDIFIGEKRVNDLAPKDRDIAMVFPDYALYPHLSVFENLAFALRRRKFSKAEIRKRVVDAASILGIESWLERKLKALSAGEQRSVAIGRAMARQPKVFLFHDPVSNLEASIREQMRRELIKLQQRLQATMIYATPDPTEAMAMGDRIVLMDNGVVQQSDAPRVLYDQPVDLFVAGFFGSPPMNFISGVLKEEGDRIRFREIEGGTIEVAFAAAARSAAREFFGKNVILGIRPEDLQATPFSREKAKTGAAGFPAIVDVVEPRGAETNLYLQTGAHSLVCRTQHALDHRDAGHRFWFEMNLEKIHLFDPVSTRRLA
jgi:multiple sugar transport system ATP-binding protein